MNFSRKIFKNEIQIVGNDSMVKEAETIATENNQLLFNSWHKWITDVSKITSHVSPFCCIGSQIKTDTNCKIHDSRATKENGEEGQFHKNMDKLPRFKSVFLIKISISKEYFGELIPDQC